WLFGGMDYNGSFNNDLWMYTPDPSCVSFCNAPNNPTKSIEEENINDLLIYPNPSNESIQIKTSGKKISLKIYDQTGREVMPVISKTGTAEIKLDVSQLAEGIYYLNIYLDEKYSGKKIIVQH
ncbi:MAG: T9SS type A sorting domain-containing protein, partial [Bacteroidia bacterium]|nr:T9SS type A sorting domain-containing protein [Bacteroidia bacterium]